MILAVVLVFVLAPATSKMATQETSVIVLKSDVAMGTQITEKHLTTIKMANNNIPSSAIKNSEDIIGKYAKTYLYANDFISAKKLTSVSGSTNDVISNITDDQVVVSISVDLVSTVSDNIERGDLIRIYATDKSSAKSFGTNTTNNVIAGYECMTGSDDYLRYVKVVAATTNDGTEAEDRTTDENGKKAAIKTLVLLLTDDQVKELRNMQKGATISIGLVCKNTDTKRVNRLLEEQTKIIEKLQKAEKNKQQPTTLEVGD